jgi:hypothetical protein
MKYSFEMFVGAFFISILISGAVKALRSGKEMTSKQFLKLFIPLFLFSFGALYVVIHMFLTTG